MSGLQTNPAFGYENIILNIEGWAYLINVELLLGFHQELNITWKNRPSLREDHAGHIRDKVNVVEAEIVAQLLPADHVAESCQVPDAFRIQLTTLKGCFV